MRARIDLESSPWRNLTAACASGPAPEGPCSQLLNSGLSPSGTLPFASNSRDDASYRRAFSPDHVSFSLTLARALSLGPFIVRNIHVSHRCRSRTEETGCQDLQNGGLCRSF